MDSVSQEISGWSLQKICKTAGMIMDEFFLGIRLITLKQEGPQGYANLWRAVLRRRQRTAFLEGYKKLGLENDPPAVGCAKYHYFSNLLGGLNMEYIEESPKKAWIRYIRWSSGSHMYVLPFESEKASFEGWHAANAEALKNPCLGYVITKLCSAGDPYYEGYFIEYDTPINPEQRLQYKPWEIGADYDPNKVPKLDEKEWPPDRLAKSRRNFSRESVANGYGALFEAFGRFRAAKIIEEISRQVAIHMSQRWFNEFGLSNPNSYSLSLFFKLLGEIQGDEMSIVNLGEKKFALQQKTCKLCPKMDLPADAFRSMSAFQETSAKTLNPRVKVLFTNSIAEGDDKFEWIIEDKENRII